MNKLIAAAALLLNVCLAFAQAPTIIREQFQWEEKAGETLLEGKVAPYWQFRGGIGSSEHPSLQFFMRRFPVTGYGQLRVEVINARFEPFEKGASPDDEYLQEGLQFETAVERVREGYYGKVAFAPIVRRGGRFERLTDIELRVYLDPRPDPVAFRGPTSGPSVLSDGQLYKVAVTGRGVHKMTYDFLKNQLEIDIDNIDPRQIKLYGNGGGKLPFYIGDERIDDLEENAIRVVGEEDGSFGPNDYILFYAEGADKWVYNGNLEQFVLDKNIYDTRNYYFLKISGGNGRRLQEMPAQGGATYTSTSFDDYARLEQESVNIFHEWIKAQGSGQSWFGDHFKVARQYSYNNAFSFPGLIASEPAVLRASMAVRANVKSRFFVDIAGQSLQSDEARSVSSVDGGGDNTTVFAGRATVNDSILLSGPSVSFTIRYPYPQGVTDFSEAWLDYVQLNVRRALRMEGAQLHFRDRRSLAHPATTFQLQNAGANIEVWDITNPLAPAQPVLARTANQLSFSANTQALREFIAFDINQQFPAPEAVGPLANQNLHGIENADMAIIYHRDFAQEALRLAQHRADLNGLTVEIVEIEQVFNEFSSGKKDPTAIRDFAHLAYQKSPNFRYLLLFGDGSFDSRDIYELGGDFIPTYQKESFNPVEAYPTDDYYGLLAGDDPTEPLNGPLNIAVGRLPVKTPEEAANAVDKIIHYDSAPATMGDWRNRLVFVGDDNDSSPGNFDLDHYKDADEIAEGLNDSLSYLNLEKIYLDAFPQESTPGGERIPEATEQLNKSIFQGALTVTYLGHGGSKGWAQERVLNISDILSWENFDQMPIFVTATCSFTGYDDPAFVTAGEEVFLNPSGGAIALMTTVRAVYASSNVRMTRNALAYIFSRVNGRVPTVGEALQRGKNDVSGEFNINNSRKFTLIGDPSMPVAVPNYKVTTTAIDGQPVNAQENDTLRALQRVTIEGIVSTQEGQLLSDFNGVIYPTIYDKAQVVSTLGQGANEIYNYRIQKNVLFRGRASVVNGRFQFSFVVPKDINYQFGPGKISYYAADESAMQDAGGSYQNIIIGGSDPNAFADDQGPKVEVFMNTADFAFGGITNPNPTLLVKLEDENGINVVGNSIGHDLEGVLNDNTQNTYLLNDFYESELDDYTKGTVRYPLSRLPEGRHNIRVKAWDVANNSSEGYTEFVVAASEEVALEHVLNYPNPFTDLTCFQFDHNLANQELDVLVQVYTISGRLVKTLQASIFSDGAIRRDDCIEWDGRDDYGDRLARGVYLYKVKVRANNIGNVVRSGESDFEKLVILK
ncbi:MAG: type IX secretion system sortase PorU [Lewinellaceae bacterium]|nr:type IX secretion system sortase PorU [Phaeodactylibacter sp.]MCB9036192.1 type IX secretion system sortase PorU [Lewinellaceae bacterium]